MSLIFLVFYFLQSLWITYALDVYVNSSYRSISGYDGSKDRPFGDIISALWAIKTWGETRTQTSYNLLLTGSKFIIEPSQLNASTNVGKLTILFTENIADITIQPVECFIGRVPNCLTIAQIDLRTSRLQILLNNTNLILRNIRICGLDMLMGHMQIENPGEDYKCLISESGCCEALTSTKDYCSPADQVVARDLSKFSRYALFQLVGNATISLFSTEFSDFYALAPFGVFSAVIGSYASSENKITIKDCIFSRLYLYDGIILFDSGMSSLLNIDNSTFSFYNTYEVKEVTASTYYHLIIVKNPASVVQIANSQFVASKFIFELQSRTNFFMNITIKDDERKEVKLGAKFINIGNDCSLLMDNASISNISVDNKELFYFMYTRMNGVINITNSKLEGLILGKNGKLFYTLDQTSLNIISSKLSKINSLAVTGLIQIVSNSIVNFRDSLFQFMSSKGDGGIINLNTKNVFKIENCIIYSVFCTFSDAGVFYLYQNNSLLVNNTSVDTMESGDDGGLTQFEFYNNCTFMFSNFSRGTSTDKGGVFKMNQFNNVYYISCSFSNNKAATYGAVVDVGTSNKVTITACFFYNNRSPTCACVILVAKNTFVIENSTINYNTAPEYGGGICVMSTNKATIRFNNFSNLFALNKHGGALYINDKNDVSIIDCNFTQIKAFLFGGAVFIFSANKVLFNRSRFNATYCENEGGVFRVDNSNNVTVGQSIFYNLTTGKGPSGLASISSKNNIFFEDCLFDTVKSGAAGGLAEMKFQNNVNIKGCLLTNIESIGFGGAFSLYVENNLVIVLSTLKNVSTRGGGGFIDIQINNIVEISYSIFFNSSSLKEGGAFALAQGNQLKITAASLELVSSELGGLIAAFEANRINLIDIKLKDINAQSFGGAIYLKLGNKLLASNLNCDGTESVDGSGGMIYADELNVINFSCCMVKRISCDINGGVFFLMQSNNLSVDNSSFIDTYAEQIGAVLFSQEANSIAITNSNFTNSQSQHRAFSVMDDSAFYLENIILEAFASKEEAGCFYFENITKSEIFIKELALKIIKGSIESVIKAINVNDLKIASISAISISSRIFFLIKTKALISNSTFKNIVCQKDQNELGCVFRIQSLSEVILSSVNFSDIDSQSAGTALFVETSLLNINIIKMENLFSNLNFMCLGGFDSNISIFLSSFYSIRNGCLNFEGVNLQMAGSLLAGINVSGTLGDSLLKCLNCENISVTNSTFLANKALKGGAIQILGTNNPAHLFRITLTNFLGCTADEGGALFIFRQYGLVSASLFEKNKATIGAGVLFQSEENMSTNYTVNITSSYFRDNEAQSEGGAVKFTGETPYILNNTYENNKSPYGRDIAAIPIRLRIVNNTLQSNELYMLTEQVSGVILSKSIIFEILDQYNQRIITQNGLVRVVLLNMSDNDLKNKSFKQDKHKNNLIIPEGQNVSIKGEQKINLVEGIGNSSNAKIFSSPPKINLSLGLTSDVIARFHTEHLENEPNMNDFNYNGNYYFVIPVTLRACERGEIFETTSKSCKRCPAGKFSLSPSDEDCRICLSNSYCDGGDLIGTNPGYWRSGLDSLIIHKCGPRQSSCLGGLNSTCEKGYEGPLCQSCVNNVTDKYALSSATCTLCGSRSLIILKLVFMASFIILFYLFIIKFTLRSQERINDDRKKFMELQTATKKTVLRAQYMKIFLNYLHIVALSQGFDLEWPDSLKSLFQYQNDMGSISDQVFSLDCFVPAEMDMPIFYLKATLIASTPYPIFLVIIIFWLIITRSNSSKLSSHLWTSLLITFTVLQPSVINSMSNFFSCKEVDTGKFFISSALTHSCYTNGYKLFMYACVLPTVLIWVFLLPGLLLLFLIRNRKNLDDFAIRSRFGYFFYGYKTNYFYWEYIIMYRKVFIILIIVLVHSSVETKGLLVLLIMGISLFMQEKLKPFIFDELNTLEYRSILVSLTTLYFGLFNFVAISELTKILLVVISISLNVFFMQKWFLGILVANSLLVKRIIARFCPRIKKFWDTVEQDFEERKRINEAVSPGVKGKELQWWTKSLIAGFRRVSEARSDVRVKVVPSSLTSSKEYGSNNKKRKESVVTFGKKESGNFSIKLESLQADKRKSSNAPYLTNNWLD